MPKGTQSEALSNRAKRSKAEGVPVAAPGRKPLIVGIGASAGGLEAFTLLLEHLPADTGMVFVLVQHLDPVRESALPDILSRATALPVHEVTNDLRVQPNHIYVIPPNTSLTIEDSILKLQPRELAAKVHRSIDFFFESLAQDQRERAIGVVLSGTASDGTMGLEAIKAEGGITFAQDHSARYDSMPRSAIAAGCVDYVCNPEDIAKELDYIAKHPFAAVDPALHTASPEGDRASATAHEDDDTPLPSGGYGSPPTGARAARDEAAGRIHAGDSSFKKILLLLYRHCGVDFSLYKSPTIQRRISRRMVLNKQESLEDYARILRGNTKELDALYSDVLISVTSFFRNPEAFDVIKQRILPGLLQQQGNDPVRVWVIGCSTGQEAYSIAMAFVEVSEETPRIRKLQVFATDLHEALLEKARRGLYSKSLVHDLSPERLRRFFVEEEGGYRVNKSLREMVVFARQNLVSDPPFSRMDLVSCRNLLIYLEPSLQKKALPMFHYALKPDGYLFLGGSESVSGFTHLFEPLDRKHKIFSRKAAPTAAYHILTKKAREEQTSQSPAHQAEHIGRETNRNSETQGFRSELDSQREADRLMVNKYAPPAVLVNADLQILQFRGPTGTYLEPPKGKATFDVLKMAREGLLVPLRAVIDKAKKENLTARRENVNFRLNGEILSVNLEVIPLKNLRERCFLILFDETDPEGPKNATSDSEKPRRTPKKIGKPDTKESGRRIAKLERELTELRDYMLSVQEQGEAANEELQASNEEVQSANEELQSINEELETSKEELESTNEELITVNEEMSNRNIELSQIYSDLNNLQSSTPLAVLLLSRDLVIRRFNTRAEKPFNLLPTDVGRPIGNVRHNLDLTDLDKFAAGVIETLREDTRDVRDNEGCYHSLRARPYVTQDGKVDGVVLMLVDTDAAKRAEEQQKLMINELNHRVKNTLATVQALARQTIRNHDTDAGQTFEARLAALSRAHDMLNVERWQGASLRDALLRALEPFRTANHRMDLEGPDVRLSPKQALALSMALHELATNAVKYGALSNDRGRVSVRWAIAPLDGSGELHLTWTEEGGPPVAPPKTKGFGSRLIERSLANDLGGDASIEFRPEGVVATIKSPLESLSGV
ncbi:MAG TPA: chemotaxis protein CheB [Aestuariivirga sp.]|nr:chemotaxis protein CheB [Aestuariivirga sp.]